MKNSDKIPRKLPKIIDCHPAAKSVQSAPNLLTLKWVNKLEMTGES